MAFPPEPGSTKRFHVSPSPADTPPHDEVASLRGAHAAGVATSSPGFGTQVGLIAPLTKPRS